MTISMVKKPVFRAFSKLFQRCSEVVWALFSALNITISGLFTLMAGGCWVGRAYLPQMTFKSQLFSSF